MNYKLDMFDTHRTSVRAHTYLCARVFSTKYEPKTFGPQTRVSRDGKQDCSLMGGLIHSTNRIRCKTLHFKLHENASDNLQS